MKKQQVRRMTLGKETLRQLDDAPLGKAAGGVATAPCLSTNCGEHLTSFVCPSGVRC